MTVSTGERISGIRGHDLGRRNPNYYGSNNLMAFRDLFLTEHMNTQSLCFLRENECYYSHITKGKKQV